MIKKEKWKLMQSVQLQDSHEVNTRFFIWCEYIPCYFVWMIFSLLDSFLSRFSLWSLSFLSRSWFILNHALLFVGLFPFHRDHISHHAVMLRLLFLRGQYALHGSNEGAPQRVVPEIWFDKASAGYSLTNYSIFSLLVTLQVQGCSLSKMLGTLRVGRWKQDNYINNNITDYVYIYIQINR